MDLFSCDLVKPFHYAQGEFLAVLLTEFSLARSGKGVKLEVAFDEQTPTMWTHRAWALPPDS